MGIALRNVPILDQSARPLSVAELVALFREDIALRLQSNRIRKRTAEKVRFVDSFAAQFGELPAAQCKRQDLTRWLLGHPEWASDHTKADACRVIVGCFRWAEREDLVPKNPFAGLRLTFDLQPRKAMTRKQYTLMMDQGQRGKSGRIKSGRALRRSLFFLRRSGARTCEMREMEWKDVDFQAGTVTLWTHKTKKSSAQARVIGLEPCLLRFLRNLHRRRGVIGGHVFLNGRGKPWKCCSFARLFRTYARKAGVAESVSAYALRHSFTVEALEAGVGERQVADQLGHSTTRYVAWYGKGTRAHGKYLAEVAAQAMQGRHRGKGTE
jgi:integrase